LGKAERAEFVCFATQVSQLTDPRRRFTLTPNEFRLINPNTLTCPVFRSERDAELTKKVYRSAPVLIDANTEKGNPWGIRLRTMFHKTNASESGDLTEAESIAHLLEDGSWLSAYEGDFGHQFDHRYSTFEAGRLRALTDTEYKDPLFSPHLAIAVRKSAFDSYLDRWSIDSRATGFLGFRRVARSTDERTIIATILPLVPSTYGWILTIQPDSRVQAILCANFNSMVMDYCLRNALSQPSIPQGVFEQLPVIPPDRYTVNGFLQRIRIGCGHWFSDFLQSLNAVEEL
jgi:hypothetical protein